jgi:hypothetical protein
MLETIEYEIILPRLDDVIEFYLDEENLREQMEEALPNATFEIITNLRELEIRGRMRPVWVMVIRATYEKNTE